MRPPDALSIALMGPAMKAGAGPEAREEEAATDSEVVAADVLAAIESKDAAAFAAALRNMMDVLRAEHEASESEEMA